MEEYTNEANLVKNMNEEESIDKEKHLIQMIKAMMGKKTDPEVSRVVIPETEFILDMIAYQESRDRIVADGYLLLSGKYGRKIIFFDDQH